MCFNASNGSHFIAIVKYFFETIFRIQSLTGLDIFSFTFSVSHDSLLIVYYSHRGNVNYGTANYTDLTTNPLIRLRKEKLLLPRISRSF